MPASGPLIVDFPTKPLDFVTEKLQDGWNEIDGERIYFVRNPALGLWAAEGRI